MVQNLVIISIVIGCVLAYFVYCYQLYKICIEYGINKAYLAFVPLLNKYVLVQVNDVYEDDKLYIPVVNKMISRKLLAFLNCIVTFIFFMTPAAMIGFLIYFITSVIIWYDIESDFAGVSNFEILFDAICCSIGLHSYQAYSLLRYLKKYNQGDLLSQENNDQDAYEGKYYEEDSDLFSEYDNREFDETNEYDVYTEEDAYTNDVQEILNEY